MLIAGRVYAKSINQSKQTQTDPEVPYKEITYKPKDTVVKTAFPVGNKAPKIVKPYLPPTPVIKTQSSVSTRGVLENKGTSGAETEVWNYLITRYTRNQTAGIMGNLQQEHNFRTDGDGLAQWNGGRKARLMAMANPYSLQTQLSFLVMEMSESNLVLPDNLEQATRLFQNSFERCGQCNEMARINYAYSILGRH